MPAPLAPSFWSHVKKTDSCWVWAHKITRDGYGVLRFRGRDTGAHRVAYELANGSIPTGLFVCHHCDNRSCVRPSHLFAGTHQQNMDDMHRKGRGVLGRRKLTDSEVKEIFSMKKFGGNQGVIATNFGVSRSTVGHIWSRYTWRHINVGAQS